MIKKTYELIMGNKFFTDAGLRKQVGDKKEITIENEIPSAVVHGISNFNISNQIDFIGTLCLNNYATSTGKILSNIFKTDPFAL